MDDHLVVVYKNFSPKLIMWNFIIKWLKLFSWDQKTYNSLQFMKMLQFSVKSQISNTDKESHKGCPFVSQAAILDYPTCI